MSKLTPHLNTVQLVREKLPFRRYCADFRYVEVTAGTGADPWEAENAAWDNADPLDSGNLKLHFIGLASVAPRGLRLS